MILNDIKRYHTISNDTLFFINYKEIVILKDIDEVVLFETIILIIT
jgi:hypothetical protein